MNVKILDCTLRDGGYNNDWCFSHNTLINLFDRITSAGLDFIEVGFIDQRRPFDPNRSIFPDSASVARIYGALDRKRTTVVAMIDYGTCDISHIQPCEESFLDGIRVIFKMHLMHEAMEFCRQLKSLGYKVFSQAVSFTTYTDDKIRELVELVNDVKPYALSVVDTYGLMFKADLFHYYDMIDRSLDPDIAMGYHAHNNFQLAFSNCIELADYHKDSPRTLLLDGSIYGMGKGCGNAPTELLAMFMNGRFGASYDLSQILEGIDVNVADMYNRYQWGYSLKGFIAASNDCHPNYVSYLLNKKTLSVKSINEILKGLHGDKKLLYDQALIERLYREYQRSACDDTEDYARIEHELSGRQVLILGPGATINSEAHLIDMYLQSHSPAVISINYIPEMWAVDYLFITNSKRYVQQSASIHKAAGAVRLIGTSNVTRANGKFDYTLDYEKLIDSEAVFADVSFIMLLKVLLKVGVNDIVLAGLDGYSSDREDNYFSSEMEYVTARQKAQEINRYVNKELASAKRLASITSLTSTRYEV